MLQNKRTATVATLAYADIFDFPLTEQEIVSYLVELKITTDKDKEALLASLKQFTNIVTDGTYFTFKKKEKLFSQRKIKEKIYKKKLVLSQSIIKLLAIIPTVKCIGISGSVAMHNAEENADIDLFIITRKDTIWTTRLLIWAVLELLGVRRKRSETRVRNLICANMYIDENHLSLPKDKQNLYTAHEIVQFLPLFSRDNIYDRFLSENKWAFSFLPNVKKKDCISKKESAPIAIIAMICSFFEPFTKALQLWYMKARTNEIIKPGFLAFHPNDMENYVLSEFNKRLKQYAV